ncbi:unnamed protein product, partial [Symbiodinium microadriaticum]
MRPLQNQDGSLWRGMKNGNVRALIIRPAPRGTLYITLQARLKHGFVWIQASMLSGRVAWKQRGKKLNTMHHHQLDVVFLNCTTGFTKSFLEYHSALQFRGCVSINAVAWAQQDVLWKDDIEHVSWNQAYSAQATGCPCSPLQHRALDKGLEGINTSTAEQTFAWLRGYASQFNTKTTRSNAFYVLLYVQQHNDLTRQGYQSHLNPFTARKQIARASGMLKRP